MCWFLWLVYFRGLPLPLLQTLSQQALILSFSKGEQKHKIIILFFSNMGKRDAIGTIIFFSGLLTNCYIFVEIKKLSKANHIKNMINPRLCTVKKLAIFPSRHSLPGRVWLETSRLGTGKSLTFFYSEVKQRFSVKIPFVLLRFLIRT